MKAYLNFVVLGIFLTVASQGFTQPCPGGYTPSGNAVTDCGGDLTPCCHIYNACNGPNSGCNNFDTGCAGCDGTTGCDLSCTPIDSGVMFLLLGGGLFGAVMLQRRKELELVMERANS